MASPIDTRDHTFKHPVSGGAAAFGAPALNPGTGTPVTFTASAGGPVKGSMLDAATSFVRSACAGFAVPAEAPLEYVPDPHINWTSSGAAAVHLQQHYRGVPVFEMTRTVRFGVDGAIQDASGKDVGLSRDFEILPKLDVREAALAAAKHVATNDGARTTDGWGQKTLPTTLDVARFTPSILARFPLPSQPTVLDKSVFDESIPAHLVVFYQGPMTRLGWHFVMTLPNAQAQFVVVVSADAAKPEILYCQESSWSVVKGKVFQSSPGRGEARIVDFPLAVSEYPLKKLLRKHPEKFPHAWVTKDECVGNCTVAVLGYTTTTMKGTTAGEHVTFTPANDDDRKVLNIFYFCNYMHDFFYLLGFDEAAGNFQEVNYSSAGLGSDPVLAQAHPGPVYGTANMTTGVDGVRAVMNMGPVTGHGHTAFDADVVFHEYGHGVTNRLVGGRMNDRALQEPQSRGMGEGWSDYFALTIQNHGKDSERVVTGDWVVGNANGIRNHKYDEQFPGRFGDIGTGIYDEEHNIGEIWCAALMQMNRNLGKALGDREEGSELGWQIVVDGLKLTKANPSFLDARDAILRALEGMRDRPIDPMPGPRFKDTRKAIWQAFSKFGMGPKAQSHGARLDGCVGDASLPADL